MCDAGRELALARIEALEARATILELRNILASCRAQTRYGTDDPETLRAWEREAWAVVSRAYHALDGTPAAKASSYRVLQNVDRLRLELRRLRDIVGDSDRESIDRVLVETDLPIP